MNSIKKAVPKGDPSDVIQTFPNYNLKLLCCRYWWLERWEFQELSFPYWRIYNNSQDGAVIIHKGVEYPLSADKIILIAPNTSYSTRIHNQLIPNVGYSLEGGRLSDEVEIEDENVIQHLFIHFNIGMPYDTIAPGLFVFDLTEHLRQKLIRIKEFLYTEHQHFSFYSNLAILSLINDLLADLPQESWDLRVQDKRILDVLSYVESNIDQDLSNSTLARVSGMADNSFSRLFAKEIGVSLQQYVKKKRIDKACILLHHSNLSIDTVAEKTGFADRYHFSRIFKQITNVSPAMYKKEFVIK